ncbi:hypothetical protein MXMO3_03458 (plasmid) [Maritalea myrionectae]|uniref:Uncharacterized protein n=1 Tax=Maritalea myrionectae TaxID=454601 RepID=A0A2R4MIX7_9HYPH|nr:hypothetical protein [Maritalea myrionectae]AVX05961.1 hypothetical protein MXMO3_03458 [Maritalea myrionectae]
MDDKALLASYGYELLSRDVMLKKRGEPFEGLIRRSVKMGLTHHHFVIVDPESDDQGFMIWGDDENILLKDAIDALSLRPIRSLRKI